MYRCCGFFSCLEISRREEYRGVDLVGIPTRYFTSSQLAGHLTIGLGWKDITVNSWTQFLAFEDVISAAYAAQTDSSGNRGASLLHWAARHGKAWSLGQLLKDPKCNLNALCSEGKTALQWAIDANNQECIDLLSSPLAEQPRMQLK